MFMQFRILNSRSATVSQNLSRSSLRGIVKKKDLSATLRIGALAEFCGASTFSLM